MSEARASRSSPSASPSAGVRLAAVPAGERAPAVLSGPSTRSAKPSASENGAPALAELAEHIALGRPRSRRSATAVVVVFISGGSASASDLFAARQQLAATQVSSSAATLARWPSVTRRLRDGRLKADRDEAAQTTINAPSTQASDGAAARGASSRLHPARSSDPRTVRITESPSLRPAGARAPRSHCFQAACQSYRRSRSAPATGLSVRFISAAARRTRAARQSTAGRRVHGAGGGSGSARRGQHGIGTARPRAGAAAHPRRQLIGIDGLTT